MISVGNLHAGIGGFSLAFQELNVTNLWANDIDINCEKTYRKNFSHKFYLCDIKDLPINELEKVNIITSGFPCQSFSLAGNQKGFDDDSRGNQFFEVMKIVNKLHPNVIFFENVKNLYSHDKGKTFDIIKQEIESAGYYYKYAILNTVDYGNLPQNRERIYIVGFKDIQSYNKFTFPQKISRTIHLKDIIDKDIVDDIFYYKEDKYNYNELSKNVINENTCYQWRRIYVRENKKDICPTLTANMGTGGHNVPIILTKYGIRKLTPRECFLLQGFPENFILPNIANSHLYKQAGNSVSVPVVQQISKNIISSIE